MEIGSRCELRLEVYPSKLLRVHLVLIRQDTSTGELFASVNYAHPWTAVEPVLDSSRYFVLRVEGEGGKRAYVGMGFAERGEAFDFQVCVRLDPLDTLLSWSFVSAAWVGSYTYAIAILSASCGSLLTHRSPCNPCRNVRSTLPRLPLNPPNQLPHQRIIL